MTGIEAVIDAAKSGDEARLRSLIAADPRLAVQRLPSGESPVMAALYRGHGDVARLLLQLGAELDVFVSAAMGDRDALKIGLAQPAAINAFAWDGWTPLHLAAFFGQFEAARILVDAGADLQAVSRNSLSNTPLHAAAAGKHERIARLLLDAGADPNVMDGGGFTALAIARENRLDLEDR